MALSVLCEAPYKLMNIPNIQTPSGLLPVTCLSDDELVEAYLSAAGGSADADVVQLLRYAVSPDNDGTKKAGAFLRCCLEGVGVLVAVYPGLGQMVPAGSVRVGDIIDGGLYFVPSAKNRCLRSKTVFDFCKDARLLEEIIYGSFEGITPSKDVYLETLNDTERAANLLTLAEMTNNKELEAAVWLEFRKELNEDLASFNE